MNAKDFKARTHRAVRVPDEHPRPADEGDDWFYPANRKDRRATPGLVGYLVSPQGVTRSLFEQTRRVS